MRKRILGIDPGSVVTGYGIIETDGQKHAPIDFGCIRLKTKLPFAERLKIIYDGLSKLIETYKPEAVSVESQFVKKNAQTALKLGMAKGAALLAAAKNDIPLFEYAPAKVKLAVVGTGAASKEQVQKMTQALLGLKEIPKPEDAADALALAICHVHNEKSLCLNI